MAETLQLFIDDDGKVYKVDPDTGTHTPLPQATATRVSNSQQTGNDRSAPNVPSLGMSDVLQRGASLAGFGTIATAIARFAAVAGLIEELRKRIEKNVDAQKRLNEARAQELAAQQDAQRTKKERDANAAKQRIKNRINNAPIDADVDISADEDNAIRRDLKNKYNQRQSRKSSKRNKSRTSGTNPAGARVSGPKSSRSTTSGGGKGSSSAVGATANAASAGTRAASTAGATAAEGAGAIAGMEGLLAMAGPVGVVVGALAAAGTALYAFKKGVDATIDSLAKYTVRTSAAIANANVKNIVQDVKHAQVLDSDMARFVEVQNEVSMMLKTIWRGIMKWGMERLLPLVELMANIAKKLFDFLVDNIGGIPDKIGPIGAAAIAALNPIIGALIAIAANIKNLKDADPVGMDPLIDALTNTLVPMHPANPANQAQGDFTVGGGANGNRRRLLKK